MAALGRYVSGSESAVAPAGVGAPAGPTRPTYNSATSHAEGVALTELGGARRASACVDGAMPRLSPARGGTLAQEGLGGVDPETSGGNSPRSEGSAGADSSFGNGPAGQAP
eukprot:8556759-Alexandrium_andersonii.AAC.1